MADGRRQLFDRLAADYHLTFADWQSAIERQGAVYDALIRDLLGPATWAVLIGAAGIGTQALGLAMRGHRVTAAEDSLLAIERLEREALQRHLHLRTAVAGLAELAGAIAGRFDVVLAADNALAQLHERAALDQVLDACHAALRPSGVLLAAVRDYDRVARQQPSVEPPRFFGHADRRRIVHQVWEWLDERRYLAHLYLTYDTGAGWQVRHEVMPCRAWLRAELTQALQAAGFRRVRWFAADDEGEPLPIVVALRG